LEAVIRTFSTLSAHFRHTTMRQVASAEGATF
jgi:hypothetical protein